VVSRVRLPLAVGRDNKPHFIWSLEDVYAHQSYSFWACHCHLRCPFCHNWKIAEGRGCRQFSVSELSEFLEELKRRHGVHFEAVDYLHFTGGEPLLHKHSPDFFREIASIGHMFGKRLSINSSLTVSPGVVDRVLRVPPDHIAFDVKVPYRELYGYPAQIADKLHSNFVKNVKNVVDSDIVDFVEARVPISRLLTPELLERELEGLQLANEFTVIVLQPLIGEGIAGFSVRDPKWSHYEPVLTKQRIEELKRVAERFAKKVVVRTVFEASG
jgi:pyruvate formate lyase activating enzyme